MTTIKDQAELQASGVSDPTSVYIGVDKVDQIPNVSRKMNLSEAIRTANITCYSDTMTSLCLMGMKDGQHVVVAGYYTFGDGGGGQLMYDADGMQTINGGSVVAGLLATNLHADYQGAWNVGTTYVSGNIVWFLGQLYVASSGTTGAVPTAGGVWSSQATTGRLLRYETETFNVKAYGANGDSSTAFVNENNGAFANCVAAAEAFAVARQSGAMVYLPQDHYIYSSEFRVRKPNVHVRGDGRHATSLRYSGSGNAVSFEASDQSIIETNSIRGLNIVCTDTTATKSALWLWEVAEFTVSDLLVQQCIGGDSTGIHFHGHEMVKVDDCQIVATIPIRMSKGSYGINQSHVDHFHFSNMLLQHGASGSPATLVQAHYLIDSNTYVANLTIDGSQALVGGSNGVYHHRASSAGGDTASTHAWTISNLRKEQGNGAGYLIDIEANNEFQIQLFRITNVYAGGATRGLRLRDMLSCQIDQAAFVHASDNLDIDRCKHVRYQGLIAIGGASAINFGTMTIVPGSGGDGPAFGLVGYPVFADYVSPPHSINYSYPTKTFADADATPSVSSAGLQFKTANTGATTITDFDDGLAGQEIRVIVDSNTTINNSAAIQLNGSANWTPASGGAITLVKDGSQWKEISRATY